MSKKDRADGAAEASRFAGLAAAAIINFGRGLEPAEILRQAEVYEKYVNEGLAGAFPMQWPKT